MKFNLSLLDATIIIGYFVVISFVGFYMSRVAAQGLDDYFLGGKKIPWWVLGASGTASNFDMTGTMVIVSFIYLIGLKGFWVAMRGGVGLPLAFLLVFLGKWYRRTQVMTEAEYMKFRFGDGPQGRLARTFSAISYLILSVGFVVYFCVGTGSFLSQFLPFPKAVCSLIMVVIGLFYTASAGLYGVVFTDFLQELMLIVVALYLTIKAFITAGALELPARFTEFSLPFTLDVPGYDAYKMFTFCVFFWVLKGVLEGMGGIGGYMSQRYYAARNEREASLLTAEWIFLLGFRWLMIMSIAVLGVTVSAQVGDNPETVLPLVLKNLLPDGIKGLALAGLIAAAMSTFDSTINAGAAFLVKDIYQALLNPKATEKQLVKAGYAASIGIALVAVILSFSIPRIDTIWNFITTGLIMGMFGPLIMRWYWNRFNGYGYAAGTGAGILTAFIMTLIYPQAPPYVTAPTVLICSVVVAIIVTLTTEPVPQEVRLNFLQATRVGGFWGPEKNLLGKDFNLHATLEHLYDIIAVILAVPMQLCYFFACMCFVTHDWPKFAFTLTITLTCAVGLYFFWYRNLPPDTDSNSTQPADTPQTTQESTQES